MLRSLFGYNRWVNQRLLHIIEQVPVERLHESLGGSFDTIQGTAAHILQGELFYFSRWMPIDQAVRPADLRTIQEIRELWHRHEARLDAFLHQLTPEAAGATVAYTRGGSTWRAPVWQLMLNLVNHSTHHRAELADMLTSAGYPPPPLDLADYFEELAALPPR